MAEPADHARAATGELPPAPPASERPAFDQGQPSEPLIYRPLSVAALAALILAVGYALFIAIGFLAAYFKKTAFLPPLWSLIFPSASGTLAWLASQQIKRSEGTKAGAKLAVWAGGLSLAFGFVYGAYYGGIYFAVRKQAHDFTLDWFDKLEKGETNAAFLYTMEPQHRKGEDPNDRDRMEARYNLGEGPQKGRLSQFSSNRLIRLLQDAGPQGKIEAKGVRDWKFIREGYEVEQVFLISTPEVVADVLVTVSTTPTTTG